MNGDDLTNFLGQAESLPGDLNLDGAANFADFLALSANFGQSERTWSHGDVDCDGTVAFPDFLTFSANFGQTAGAEAAAVPEPAGAQLLLLSLAMFFPLLRRRR